MSKQLGKGLEELFADNTYLKEVESDEKTNEIQLSRIIPNPHQPRKYFDETQLNELAESITQHGVFTPIIVTFDGFKYVIVAGERRFRASKLAGKTTIPAIVREYSESDMMEIALLENIQREDLTILEVAESYASIINKLELTHEVFAKRIGKSRSQVTNILGLLTLPVEVKSMIEIGKLSFGHARVLSKIKDPDKCILLANKVVQQNLTVRDLENLSNFSNTKIPTKENSDSYINNYKKLLKSNFSNVKLTSDSLTIKFGNEEELKLLVNLLLKNE